MSEPITMIPFTLVGGQLDVPGMKKTPDTEPPVDIDQDRVGWECRIPDSQWMIILSNGQVLPGPTVTLENFPQSFSQNIPTLPGVEIEGEEIQEGIEAGDIPATEQGGYYTFEYEFLVNGVRGSARGRWKRRP